MSASLLLASLALAAPTSSSIPDNRVACAVSQMVGVSGLVLTGVGAAANFGSVVNLGFKEPNPVYTTLGQITSVASIGATTTGFVARPFCTSSSKGRLLGPALLISSIGLQVGASSRSLLEGGPFDILAGIAAIPVGLGLAVTGGVLTAVSLAGLSGRARRSSVVVMPMSSSRPGLSIAGRW